MITSMHYFRLKYYGENKECHSFRVYGPKTIDVIDWFNLQNINFSGAISVGSPGIDFAVIDLDIELLEADAEDHDRTLFFIKNRWQSDPYISVFGLNDLRS